MSANNESRNKCNDAATSVGGARLGVRNAIVLDRKIYAYCYNPTKDWPDCRQFYPDEYAGLIWEYEGMYFKIPAKDLVLTGNRKMNDKPVFTARLSGSKSIDDYLFHVN